MPEILKKGTTGKVNTIFWYDARHTRSDPTKKAGTKALQYTTTEGYAPLREGIARRMNQRLGTIFDKDNILITHGSQQGLDLSGKVFLDEGGVVLCENENKENTFRINYSNMPEDKMEKGLKTLGEVVKEFISKSE